MTQLDAVCMGIDTLKPTETKEILKGIIREYPQVKYQLLNGLISEGIIKVKQKENNYESRQSRRH